MALGGGAPSHRSPPRAVGRTTFAHQPRTRLGQTEAVRDRASQAGTAPYALWVLRLALGGVFLAHVMGIVFGYVPTDASQLFGLPPGVSPWALAWDTLLGLALIYGFWPRAVALLSAATLAPAAFGPSSAFGWHYAPMWIAGLIGFAVAGDGAFALIPTLVRKESFR
jgi:putative oxidoreductase